VLIGLWKWGLLFNNVKIEKCNNVIIDNYGKI